MAKNKYPNNPLPKYKKFFIQEVGEKFSAHAHAQTRLTHDMVNKGLTVEAVLVLV